MEGNSKGSFTLMKKIVGKCPDVTVSVQGVDVCCLLDTGAQVSTLTEAFYQEHLAARPGIELLDISQVMKVVGTQGAVVPYRGYVELDLMIADNLFPGVGFLVVRDPVNTPIASRKIEVPGVIGSNVFRDVKEALVQKHGQDYKDVLTQSTDGQKWAAVISMYEELVVANEEHVAGKVRIGADKPVLIPAGSVQVVPASVTPSSRGLVYYAVVEEVDTLALPKGIKIGPTCVAVDKRGQIPCSVVNTSTDDVYLYPRTQIARLEACKLPDDRPTGGHEPSSESNARTGEGICPTASDLVKQMDWGAEATEEQVSMVTDLVNQYSDVFSKGEGDIGLSTTVTHRIRTKDDHPVRVPHRRVPPQHWEELRQHLKQWIDKGIIRESASAYAAPIVIVRKKNGDLRMCIDYRGLNAKTHFDAYPLPRIEEALDVLRGAKYFCSLDLAHGYYQVPVAEEDIPKTAFRSGTGGLYEFTRMCFGLAGAPATFMRLMDKLFGDLNFRDVLIYLDDILVFGSTIEETLGRLETVLQRLQKENLKVKPAKCQMLHRKLRYLGHLVSEDGVAPDPGKLSAIRDWPRPSDARDVRKFLGLAGYYRRFVPQFAKVAQPLHLLVGGTGRKGKKPPPQPPWNWSSECETAWQSLKDALTSAPILGYPDF